MNSNVCIALKNLETRVTRFYYHTKETPFQSNVNCVQRAFPHQVIRVLNVKECIPKRNPTSAAIALRLSQHQVRLAMRGVIPKRNLTNVDSVRSVFHNQVIRLHKRMHTKVKPYKCSHCSKTFSTSSETQGLRASSLQFTSPLEFNAIFCDGFTLRHELTAGSKIRDPVTAKFKHVTVIVTCTLLCCDDVTYMAL